MELNKNKGKKSGKKLYNARPAGNRRPAKNQKPPSQHANNPPPKILPSKPQRSAAKAKLAADRLTGAVKECFGRWCKAAPGMASPALLGLKGTGYTATSLVDLTALMDAVAQSGRSEDERDRALETMASDLSQRYFSDASLSQWTDQAVLSAISAMGKAPTLPSCRRHVGLFIRVLLEYILLRQGKGAQPKGKAAQQSRSLVDAAGLALLINRLSKFSKPQAGSQDYYADLEAAISELATITIGVLSQKDQQDKFTFKQLGQLSNGFGHFRHLVVCSKAMTLVIEAAQPFLAVDVNTPPSLDQMARGLSVINLCAYVSGLASFAGMVLVIDDTDSTLTAHDLHEAMEAAARLATSPVWLKCYDLAALAQLVRGFGNFSRLPSCRRAVLLLAAPTAELMKTGAMSTIDELQAKGLSMLIGGMGSAWLEMVPKERRQIEETVKLVIANVPVNSDAYEQCGFELLAFLLHGLARFPNSARTLLGSVIEAATTLFSQILSSGGNAAVRRLDMRSLVIFADALRHLALARRQMPIVGLFAAVLSQKLAIQVDVAPWIDRLTAGRLSLLMRSMSALVPVAGPQQSGAVGATLDSLAKLMKGMSKLPPLALAQSLLGLSRQSRRALAREALAHVLDMLTSSLKEAAAPEQILPILRQVRSLAEGLMRCRADGVIAVRHNVEAALAELTNFIAKHAPAQKDAGLLVELMHSLVALPVSQNLQELGHTITLSALQAIAHAGPEEMEIRADLLSLCIDHMLAGPGDETEWYRKAASELLTHTTAGIQSGDIVGSDVLRVFEFAGRRDVATLDTFIPLVTVGFKSLWTERVELWSHRELWKILQLVRNCAMLVSAPVDLLELAQDLWQQVLGRLQNEIAFASDQALDGEELALNIARFATTDSGHEFATMAREVVRLCAWRLTRPDMADWWGMCPLEHLTPCLAGLARSQLYDELSLCLDLFAQGHSDDTVFAAELQAASESTLAALGLGLQALISSKPPSLTRTLAALLTKNHYVAAAAQALKAAASRKADPSVLFSYTSWKCCISLLKVWDTEPDLAKLSADAVQALSKDCTTWLHKPGAIEHADRATWSLITQLEGTSTDLANLLLAVPPAVTLQSKEEPAKFSWQSVFDQLGGFRPRSPAGGAGIKHVPRFSLSQFMSPEEQFGDRYTILHRLTGGQLDVVQILLPAEVNPALLRAEHVFNGRAYRVDIAGGSGMKNQRDKLEEMFAKVQRSHMLGLEFSEETQPGRLYSVPSVDTRPGSDFHKLMQALFPNVEAFYYFQRALMNGGPSHLAGAGPASHALEGSFEVLFVPDAEVLADDFRLANKASLFTHDGFGFIKASVAAQMGWFKDANTHYQDKTAKSKLPADTAHKPPKDPLPLFGGMQPNANLPPDALQHYPADADVAKELAGDVEHADLNGANVYRVLTQGCLGKGHIGKAVASSDGHVHMPSAKKVGPNAIAGRAPYEFAKLQAIDNNAVVQDDSPTREVLDTCIWVQYSFVGQDKKTKDLSFCKGAAFIIPDEWWPKKYPKVDMIWSAEEEKTRTKWISGKSRYTLPTLVSFAGIMIVVEAFAPGSCIAVPPGLQAAMDGDLDGDDVLVASNLPHLHALVHKHVQPPPSKPDKSHQSGVRNGVYDLGRGDQLAAVTRNVLGQFTALQRMLKFLPLTSDALVDQLAKTLCSGLTESLYIDLDRLWSDPKNSQLGKSVCDALELRAKQMVAPWNKLLLACAADVRALTGLGGKGASTAPTSPDDPLQVVAGAAAKGANPRQRIALWLKHSPINPSGVPAEVSQLVLANKPRAALELLVLIGIKAGEDAYKSDTRIADLYPLAKWLYDAMRGWSTPPYTRRTAQAIAEGAFDARVARSVRDGLQAPPNLAAAVMLETLSRIMDSGRMWKQAARYAPPKVPVQPGTNSLMRTLVDACEEARDAVGSEELERLEALTASLFVGEWSAHGLGWEHLLKLASTRVRGNASLEAAWSAFQEALTEPLARAIAARHWLPGSEDHARVKLAELLYAMVSKFFAHDVDDHAFESGNRLLLINLIHLTAPSFINEVKNPARLLIHPGWEALYYRLLRPVVRISSNNPPASLAECLQSLAAGGNSAQLRQTREIPVFSAQSLLDCSMWLAPKGRESQEFRLICFGRGMSMVEPWYHALVSQITGTAQQRQPQMQKAIQWSVAGITNALKCFGAAFKDDALAKVPQPAAKVKAVLKFAADRLWDLNDSRGMSDEIGTHMKWFFVDQEITLPILCDMFSNPTHLELLGEMDSGAPFLAGLSRCLSFICMSSKLDGDEKLRLLSKLYWTVITHGVHTAPQPGSQAIIARPPQGPLATLNYLAAHGGQTKLVQAILAEFGLVDWFDDMANEKPIGVNRLYWGWGMLASPLHIRVTRLSLMVNLKDLIPSQSMILGVGCAAMAESTIPKITLVGEQASKDAFLLGLRTVAAAKGMVGKTQVLQAKRK